MATSTPAVVTVAAPSVREGVAGVGDSFSRLLNTSILGPLTVKWLLIILIGFLVVMYVKNCAKCQENQKTKKKQQQNQE